MARLQSYRNSALNPVIFSPEWKTLVGLEHRQPAYPKVPTEPPFQVRKIAKKGLPDFCVVRHVRLCASHATDILSGEQWMPKGASLTAETLSFQPTFLTHFLNGWNYSRRRQQQLHTGAYPSRVIRAICVYSALTHWNISTFIKRADIIKSSMRRESAPPPLGWFNEKLSARCFIFSSSFSPLLLFTARLLWRWVRLFTAARFPSARTHTLMLVASCYCSGFT
jgi:hypothetical protein